MKTRQPPAFEHISVLVAMILLAYISARFVDLPSRLFEITLMGIFLNIEINVNTVVSVMVAGLAISGVNWLIQQHPELRGRGTLHHWVLPGLTAWILGVALNSLSTGILWWIVFSIGAGLLILVLIAEYIVVDNRDARFPAAAAGLTALSFALYFILAITLRSEQVRLFLLLPGLSIPIGLICFRYIYLRLYYQAIFSRENAFQAFLAGLVVAVILGQITTSLHYWPLSLIGFGLALLGPAYSLTILLGNFADGKKLSNAIYESILILIIIWGFAAAFGQIGLQS